MNRLTTAARRVGSAAVGLVLTAGLLDELCDCGRPLPEGRAFCSTGCALADKDHGRDDEPGGTE
jgi:hypothetical protein